MPFIVGIRQQVRVITIISIIPLGVSIHDHFQDLEQVLKLPVDALVLIRLDEDLLQVYLSIALDGVVNITITIPITTTITITITIAATSASPLRGYRFIVVLWIYSLYPRVLDLNCVHV